MGREEAAQLLSISQRGLDYLVASKRLPTRRIGGRVLIPMADLRKYARCDHPNGSWVEESRGGTGMPSNTSKKL